MEALAVSLKEDGSYLSRHLSTDGITHEIIRIPLTDEFKKLYEDCTSLVSFELFLQFT